MSQISGIRSSQPAAHVCPTCNGPCSLTLLISAINGDDPPRRRWRSDKPEPRDVAPPSQEGLGMLLDLLA